MTVCMAIHDHIGATDGQVLGVRSAETGTCSGTHDGLAPQERARSSPHPCRVLSSASLSAQSAIVWPSLFGLSVNTRAQRTSPSFMM